MPGLGAVPLAEGAKVAEEAKEGRVELQIIQLGTSRDAIFFVVGILERCGFLLRWFTPQKFNILNPKHEGGWKVIFLFKTGDFQVPC